jgi:hypothetical protein
MVGFDGLGLERIWPPPRHYADRGWPLVRTATDRHLDEHLGIEPHILLNPELQIRESTIGLMLHRVIRESLADSVSDEAGADDIGGQDASGRSTHLAISLQVKRRWATYAVCRSTPL